MSDQVSMDVLALEARRVYCMHMRNFNRSKGNLPTMAKVNWLGMTVLLQAGPGLEKPY